MSMIVSPEKERMARRRAAKLAMELRTNLRRRKEQSRGRDDASTSAAPPLIMAEPDDNSAKP